MKNGDHGLINHESCSVPSVRFRVLLDSAYRRADTRSCNLFDLMVRSRCTPGSPCRCTVRLIVFEPPLSKEVEHEWAVTGLEGAVAADGRGIPRARRQASRTRRSPPTTRL